MPRPFDPAIVAELLDPEARGPAAAWLHRGEGSVAALDSSSAAAAIEAATRLKLVARLQQAQADAAHKDLRKQAGAGLHKLKTQGMSVAPLAPAAAWSFGAAEAPPPPVFLLGAIQPNGYFAYAAVSYGAEDVCLAAGNAGGSQGFRDDEHGHSSRSGARKFVSGLKEAGWQEVPAPFALLHLERAFARAGRLPAGWGHLMSHVPASARLTALAPVPGLPEVLDEDALHDISAFNTGPQPLQMLLDSPAFAQASQRAVAAVGAKLEEQAGGEPDPEQINSFPAALAAEVADALLSSDEDRQTWAHAFDVMAGLASLRGDEVAARAAGHNALAVLSGRPGRDIPLFLHCAQQFAPMGLLQGMQGSPEGLAHLSALSAEADQRQA
jgi:hypothetical protein